jgi:ABC-type uncharacterized transport system permease subunit
MDPVFRSKVDLWLVALIVGIPVLVIARMLEGTAVDDRDADLIAIGTVVVVLAFFVRLYLTTRYTVTPTAKPPPKAV